MKRRIWSLVFLLLFLYALSWAPPANWLEAPARATSFKVLARDTLACLAGFILWGFFFAQFILPLQTISDRFRAVWRLFAHFFGMHGPAIFVENGVPREHTGEEDKSGPGLIWLDTASGAILKRRTGITRTVGPGIYFTARGETLGGTVDLHRQKQVIGPRPGEDPFATKPKDTSDEAALLAYEEARKRASETIAYTNDHHPVVPNIIVFFKINAQPASGVAPGSRFGFDKEAVYLALTRGTMVDASQEAKHTEIQWNELPAHIAAEVWREMLEKYRFSDLFQPMPAELDLGTPPPPPKPQTPPEPAKPTGTISWLKEYLGDLDRWLAHQVHILNKAFFAPKAPETEERCQQPEAPPRPQQDKITVMEFIQQIMRYRLAHPMWPEVDSNGEPTGRWLESPEYRLLLQRGIKVQTVIVTNLRFKKNIDDLLLYTWTEHWAQRALARAQEIEQQLEAIGKDAQHQATVDFCEYLARRVNRNARHFLAQRGKARTQRAAQQILFDTHNYLTGNELLRQRCQLEIKQISQIQHQVREEGLEQERSQ